MVYTTFLQSIISMRLFTTLTMVNMLDVESTSDLIHKSCSKYLLVHEKGKNNDNPHIHIYLETEKWSSTDTLTRRLKQFYKKDFISNMKENNTTTRKLVVTKKVKSLKGVLDYMLKEQKFTENLKYSGFDENYIKILFKKLGIKNLDKDYVKLSLIKAPLKLHQIIPEEVPIDMKVIMKYLMRLMKEDNLITHHLLDDRQLEKIMYGVIALRL